MPTSTASATWTGGLEDGDGSLSVGSEAFTVPYTYASRFGDGEETNPEELIGAAEAGCFAMAFSLELQENGYDPEEIQATASVTLDTDSLEITTIELDVTGRVPDIDEDTFAELANGAKEGCPVSKALAGPEITLTASLA